MNCEEARDLMDAYALGALTEDETRRLEAHLRTCVAECPQLLADAREVAEALALAVPLRQPPAGLRAKVMAAIAEAPAERAEVAPAAAIARSRRRRGVPTQLLAIAAGVAALAVGVGGATLAVVTQGRLDEVEQRNVALQRQIEQAGAAGASARAEAGTSVVALTSRITEQQTALAVMSAPDTQSVKLEGSGPAAEATAYYYWSRSAAMGVLVCSNLPTPAPGQEYQMWVNRGTFTQDAGNLTVSPDRTAMALVLLSGKEPFSGMNVTLPGTGQVLATASYEQP